MSNEEWTVWGDAAKPVLVDTEASCKRYIEEDTHRADEQGLYLSDPDGEEYVFDGDTWTKA